jgi:hypothetical protein
MGFEHENKVYSTFYSILAVLINCGIFFSGQKNWNYVGIGITISGSVYILSILLCDNVWIGTRMCFLALPLVSLGLVCHQVDALNKKDNHLST